MSDIDIREFRKELRKFEHFLGHQLLDCCCGISVAQCHALLAIEDLRSSTIGDLADQLKLDKSTTSRTVESLVQLGLVNRKSGSDDRRVAMIALTQQGIDKAEQINAVNDQYFLQVFDHIPKENHAKVVDYISMFIEGIDKHERRQTTAENCCDDQN
jgi:DNA-binding MarR family transcriptional regulator